MPRSDPEKDANPSSGNTETLKKQVRLTWLNQRTRQKSGPQVDIPVSTRHCIHKLTNTQRNEIKNIKN